MRYTASAWRVRRENRPFRTRAAGLPRALRHLFFPVFQRFGEGFDESLMLVSITMF
jgi:hypothetical protein